MEVFLQAFCLIWLVKNANYCLWSYGNFECLFWETWKSVYFICLANQNKGAGGTLILKNKFEYRCANFSVLHCNCDECGLSLDLRPSWSTSQNSKPVKSWHSSFSEKKFSLNKFLLLFSPFNKYDSFTASKRGNWYVFSSPRNLFDWLNFSSNCSASVN